MQCLFFFLTFVATTFDWHLFWPVEMNRPQMIYNKAGPRAVWTLYDRSGLCESVSVCLSQCVSSLFPASPEVRQIRSHISFCGSHGSQKCTWPQGSCNGGFFYILLLKEQPWLMHILLSPLCCWILWSFMQRDWMCVWGGDSAKHILCHVCPGVQISIHTCGCVCFYRQFCFKGALYPKITISVICSSLV